MIRRNICKKDYKILKDIIKQWRTSKVTFETVWELLKAFKCKPNDLFKITK